MILDYWTDVETKILKEVGSLEETGDLALVILERMKATGREIVQICGPLTTGGLGSLDMNMARFEFAIRRAQRHDLLVFNQIPFQEAIITLSPRRVAGEYNMGILEIFYRKIFESGHVSRTLFLPEWESSFGARWERELVTTLGISNEDFPEEWLE
jgi:hypothetical protein